MPAKNILNTEQFNIRSELKNIVIKLTEDIGPRNLVYKENLDRAQAYIENQFKEYNIAWRTQDYIVRRQKVANVIASIGPKDAKRLIVGAHYDSHGDQVGADDNASGVAALLLLSRILKEHENKLDKRIDFVAYTLEEPPFFRTSNMGSYVHAQYLKDNNIEIDGMVCLEMLGYFSDEENSQSFPLKPMESLYPNTGNFIAIISNLKSGKLKRFFKQYMNQSDISTRTLSAPASMVGVDFSDHLNYWALGFPAIMITDTSFYRNPHYHRYTDTAETLDFEKMAQVVEGLASTLLEFAMKK